MPVLIVVLFRKAAGSLRFRTYIGHDGHRPKNTQVVALACRFRIEWNGDDSHLRFVACHFPRFISQVLTRTQNILCTRDVDTVNVPPDLVGSYYIHTYTRVGWDVIDQQKKQYQ